MNDAPGDTRNFALMVLAGVVVLMVAGVVAIAAATGGPAPPPAAALAPAAAVAALGSTRVYFEPGSDALPPDASELLVKIADEARADAGKVVQISVFHDASGDAAKNAQLAKGRALVVRHALEANGVAPDHLVLDKPTPAPGAADAREGRRVELRLR